jgi:hypothetical protein
MSTLNFRKGFGTRPSNYSEGSGYWEILDKNDLEDICEIPVLWKAMSDIAPAGTVFGYLADRDSYLGYWPPNKVR